MAEKAQNTDLDSDATYDHVLKYTGLFGGVQGLTMLVSLVRNKISSELLGPSGLALVNIFNNAIKLTNHASNFGISFSAVKYVAELSDEENAEKQKEVIASVRMWSLIAGLLGMLVMLILCNVISTFTFETSNLSWVFAYLSPIVAMMSVQTGEIAILKGLKKLKHVALVSVFGAILVLAVCAPVYLFWKVHGIVFALLASNALLLAVTLYYSNKAMPWCSTIYTKKGFLDGMPMLKLGIGYLIAGIFGQGAEYVIRTLILRYGDLEDVGLYGSGYTLAVTYAGMVFVAIEADFFPRLSSANNDVKRRNAIINQQIEACLLLVAPILIFFVVAMPVIVPVLYSSRFVDAVPMAICATGYMFFRSLTLPVAYLPLSKGDSKVYMLTELVYDVFIALLIPQAFRLWGLEGAGWALTLAGLFDFAIIHGTYRFVYSFRIDTSKISMYIVQAVLFATAVYVSLCDSVIMHWGIGVLLFFMSVFFTIRILRKETTLLRSLSKKIVRKWRK